MVAVKMSASPCRAAFSHDSGKEMSASSSSIPDCMPGSPSRWFFSLQHLHQTNPSLKAGIDLEKELYYRQQAAGFIHELGSKLQLSHLVMNVAMVYMHRFYVFHSFRRFPRNDVAAACTFLAAKVEEMPRKLEYVVKVSYALQHREEPPLDVKSNRYNEEAQKVITYENILLQTLGFELTVAVPNQFVVKCIQMVKAPKELAHAAYHFTNDCLHLTTLCLRYRPSVVACASIFLACSWAKWEIPTSHEGKPWYYYVDSEVTKEILEALAEEIVNVYQKCPERLKIKRYMGTKREENTSGGGASTSESATMEETQPSALYNAITTAVAASKMKPGPGSEIHALDTGKQDSTQPTNPESSTIPKHISTGGYESGEKKLKAEIAKVDLKSYMDRLKERKPEQASKTTTDPANTTGPRKSFMPDVSSVTKEMEGQHERAHEDRQGKHHRSSSGSGSGNPHRHRVKMEHNRHHADESTGDASVGKKRNHEMEYGEERERKMMKMEGGHHGASREHRRPTGLSGDSKSGANGAKIDEMRERMAMASHSSQHRSNVPHRPLDSNVAGMPDDATLRQAAQKAQMLKMEKLEKLKSMNMKLAATGASSGNREKHSNTKLDGTTGRPPLPAKSPPPLPPAPPPPPPPPPPPAQ